tara:strand:- start:40 stop:2673 length:2634 start_codon:yes stop_codon:yes gene_type:complete
MVYKIIVGRSDSDREKLGERGIIFIGRSYVKMGQTVSLSNEIYLDVAKAHVMMICGKRGSGKCLTGDSLITLEDGSLMPIKNLEEDNNQIISLNDKLKIEKAKKTEFFKREVDKVFKVTLRSGKEIKLTPEHPLLTIKGWKPAQELNIGSRIATPRNIPLFGNHEMSEHEIKLLAYLIAEGHTKKVVLFSNTDKDLVDEFRGSMYELCPEHKLIKEKEGHYRVSYPGWKNKVTDTSKLKFGSGGFIKGNKIIIEKRPIRKLIEKYGLFGKLAIEKEIPQEILKLKKPLLSLFLNRLFSCDGSIYCDSGCWEMSYSSSSEKLIRQVQHLLLRFGILCKLRKKKVKCEGKYFDSFELVMNAENILKYIDEIGFFGKKAERQKPAVKEISEKILNTNVDTIPREIWELFRPKNWAAIGRYAGYKHPKAMRERIRYSPSRGTLQMIGEAENNNGLLTLAQSDVFWDEIVAIESIEEKTTVYDFSVPELHNFVANDVIVHNSYSLACIAEELSQLEDEVARNIATVILDTMGIFWTMKYANYKDEALLKEWELKPRELGTVDVYVPEGHFKEYKTKGMAVDYPFSLRTSELSAGDWGLVFGIELTEPIGVLIERALSELEGEEYDVDDIIEFIKKDKKSEKNVKDAAENRFTAVKGWGLFSKSGTKIKDILHRGRASVVDVSVYSHASDAWRVKNLVIGFIANRLFLERMVSRKIEELEAVEAGHSYFGFVEKREDEEIPYVWLMLDEAHSALPKEGETPATRALVRLLREGRQPGISLVLATQQPGEIHPDVMTQSDIVLSHRLTARKDIDALNSMMQSYLSKDIVGYLNNLPHERGAALILDDNSERIYPLRVRPRFTWHGGEEPVAVKVKKKALLDLGL